MLFRSQKKTNDMIYFVQAENLELEGDLKTGFKFSNFDLGLESLLRTPLDDLSLQIDNIDILNNRWQWKWCIAHL